MKICFCFAGAAASVLASLLLLAGCRTPSSSSALQRFEFREPHMGTLFSITFYAPDRTTATNAAAAAFARIASLDRMMTDYDPDSELMQLCQRPAGTPVRVSDDLFDVLQKALRVAELSDGAFDVTVGPYVRLWRRARRTQTLPSAEMLTTAGEPVGYRKLRLDARNKTVTLTAPNMQLDLGGIAKGHAADQALLVLKQRGIHRALVAASGDIVAGDAPPGKPGWRVGIGTPDPGGNSVFHTELLTGHGQSPRQAERSQVKNEDLFSTRHLSASGFSGSKLAKTVLLRNAAVSTSGDTEQFVEINGMRYSHIVNPKTGTGLTERIQVSILGRTAAETDSFATAVSVLGVKRGLALVDSQPSLAALILKKNGDQSEMFASRRFKKIPQAD